MLIKLYSFFFSIYTFFNLSHSLYLFIFPKILPWYHSSFFLLSSFILFFFCYHPLSINFSFTLSFFTYFSLTKRFSISLSLTKRFSLNVLVDFYFLLHLRFNLINFCIFKNSNLGWYDLVLCFKLLLLLLFCSLIVKFYPITL